MTDTSPYRYLCTLLEGNPYFQEINKRRAWLEIAELAAIAPSLTFNSPAKEYVPEVLRAIVAHSGDDGLRTLLVFLGNEADYGYAGHTETQAKLMALLKGSVLAELKAAILAPPPLDSLTAAIAHFDALPTDTIPPIQPLPIPHKMPLPPNPDFVGRENEFKAMAKAVKAGQVAVVAAGIGGVGKTQLAVEWVHRYGHYFKGGVFWLDFSRPADLALEVATAGTEYRLPGYHGLEIEAKVEEVKRKWAEPTPTLLIFDNCEDPALAQAYLPTTGGARILLTSRDQTWTTTLRRVQQIPIETLPRDKSIQLLQRFRPNLQAEVANRIAHELGDLPLALHLAGSYLKQMKGTSLGEPATYLATLKNPNLVAELEAQLEWVEGTLPTAHDWSVAKTFAVSMARLESAKRVDHDLLRTLLLSIAHFAPGVAIPVAWLYQNLPQGKSEAHAKRAFTTLLKLGLVEEPAEGSTLRMHRLVAQVVFASATPETVASARTRSETVILAVKPTYGQSDFVGQMDRWLPHAREVAERALPRRDEQAATVAVWIGYLTEKLGLYDQVLPLYEEVLGISREALGARHPKTATSLNNLAGLYESQGRYEAAEPLYEEALGISREVLGARHPDTATSLNNLAALYSSQGRYEEAEPLYEEVLGIRRQVLGVRHPKTATSLNNLAWLYESQGRYEEAEPLYEEALGIRREVLGARHPDTATSLNNLAALCQSQGKYEAALPLYEEALGIRREVLGARHPDTATSLNNLAALYYHQGLYKKSLAMFDEIVSIFIEALGINHPNTKTVMANRDAIRSIIQ